MSNEMIMYMLIGVAVLFGILVIAYIVINKKLQSSEIVQIQKLRQGTQEKKYSSEVIYQKLYVFYRKIPFIKRYLLKVRRKLEIINIDDEYLTRKQAAAILSRTFLILIPLTIIIIVITHQNYLLMTILLIFEL